MEGMQVPGNFKKPQPQEESTTVMRLRQLLWSEHACEIKYGDDGELQCVACMIDFRRDSIEDIEIKLFYGRVLRTMRKNNVPDGSTL